jgi:type 2A phosphatase activator TIP41
MSGRLPDDITIALRDPNILVSMLPVVEHDIEGVCLAGAAALPPSDGGSAR